MRVKLQHVCEKGSSSLKQSDLQGSTGSYPVFGASGFICYADYYHQEKPYVAIVKDGAGIGRTSLLPAKSSVIGTMQYLIPKDCVIPEYLCYVVRYMHLEKYFSGATIPHIYFRDYKDEEFNLESIERQSEIVEVLGRLEHIIENRKQQLISLENLIKARFVEMFGSFMPDWPIVTIDSICTNTRTGPFGSSLHHNEFVKSGVFVLGIDNAVENKFSYARLRYITKDKYQQLKRYTVFPDDVIITIMGTVGRSAVIPKDIPLAINTKHLACLTPDHSKVDSVFLCNVFQMHPAIREQLASSTKGAIMEGLNLGIIRNLRFPLPPISIQKEFSLFFTQVDKSKVVVQKALDKAQQLFDSLMQEYFG